MTMTQAYLSAVLVIFLLLAAIAVIPATRRTLISSLGVTLLFVVIMILILIPAFMHT